MSEMSQASAPSGGDPLDLTPDTPGVEGDALPGAGVDTAEESGDAGDGVSDGAMDLVSDPSPEGGATLDPPDSEMSEASGVDPLQGQSGSGMPGGGDLESGADPMPDMSGTS